MVGNDKVLMELLAIPGVSGHEDAVKQYVSTYLRKLGMKVRYDPYGNMHSVLPGNMAGTVGFCCHLDTVALASGALPVLENGMLYSSGTALGADDRAGVAAVLCTLGQLVKMEHNSVCVLFTVEEETGLKGSRNADLSAYNPSIPFFVADAARPVGSVILTAPEKHVVSFVFCGKEGHATSSDGKNAILMMSQAVVGFEKLRREDIVMNYGLASGGTGVNVVAGNAVLTMDVRGESDTCRAFIRTLEREAGVLFDEPTCVKMFDELSYEGYSVPSGAASLEIAERCIGRLGLPFAGISSKGGSDVNVFREKGLDAILLGTGYAGPHSIKERIPVSEFHKLVDLLVQIAIVDM